MVSGFTSTEVLHQRADLVKLANMYKRNQVGSISIAVVVAVAMTLFFFAATGFGVWAFLGRQDFKDNVDEKIAQAVEVAKTETGTVKEAEFAERDKSPTKIFRGSETFGALRFSYPRTWSAYLVNGAGSTPVDATLHPDLVTNNKDTAFALRLQILESAYDSEVKEFETDIEEGRVTSSPYSLKQVPGVVGVRLSGEIDTRKTGTLVLLPLRDKTIKIWTEGGDFVGDFDKFILESLTFQP